MSHRVRVCLALLLVTVAALVVVAADQGSSANGVVKPRVPKDQAIAFCRDRALARLKYVTTVEWSDIAREEEPGTWIISGIRTAKAPSENADQQSSCRVQIVNNTAQLKFRQIFKESSKTGKDVFERR